MGHYYIGGRRWPGKTIKYYNALPKKNKDYQKGMKKAIAEWNSRGLPVKFVEVKSKKKAQFVISHSKNLGGYSGLATIGYWGRGENYFLKMSMAEGKWEDIAWVASHELGHILGLDHSTGCSVMSYSAYSDCEWSEPGQDGMWRCRLQEKDDLKGAQRLYGGKYKLRKSPFCVKNTAPGKVKTLKASVKQGTISLAWKKASKATEYRVVQGKRGGTCPSKPPLNNGSQNWHVLKSNKAKFTDEYLKPGKYCFAVYSVNKDGYVNVKSKATVTADLNLPTLKVPEVTDVTIKDASSEWDRAWVLRAKVRASALDGAAGDVTVRVCGKKDELAWVTGSGGVKDVAWLFSYDGFAPGQSVCLEFWNAGYWGNAKLKSETVKVTVKLPAAPTLSAPDITDLAVKDLGYDGVSDWGIQAKVRATAINGSAAYVQVGLCGEDYQTQAYGDGSLQEVLRLYSYYGFVKGQSVCLEFKSESYWGGEALRSKPVQKTVTLP